MEVDRIDARRVDGRTELLLPEVAAHHRVAVLVDAIDEVLAGDADHALLVPKISVALIAQRKYS